MTVRTRVAPSPTGDPHVGTAYMALFNYCFARAHGGQFIVRIEDTDQVRSTAESERVIMESLRWLGLSWDEGPDVGGPHGPYRQSERTEIYREHAARLLETGQAFRCFCTAERLDDLRKAQTERGDNVTGYDGHCMHLGADEVREKLDAGVAHVVRLVVPREGVCEIPDLLRGTIEYRWDQIDMQVLVKSDGFPTYHLANVVDDHLMGITHVIRGEEWISSAPKHLLLYAAFGWQAPTLCHMPLLRNPDKSKLSKRKNPTSILWYKRMGYLPEALLNYLGLMAWSMPGEVDKFSLEEMVAAFDIERVSKAGPIFDLARLNWLNGRYVREDLDDERFVERVREWLASGPDLRAMVGHVRSRTLRFTDLVELAGYLYTGDLAVPEAALLDGKLEKDDVRRALHTTLERIEQLAAWTVEAIEPALRDTADALGVKLRDYLRPLYVAISGKPSALPLFDSMAFLGRDLTRHRLRAALETLGAPSKRELKRWGG
jgi:glutamyl-tRNA synthetase